MAGEGEHSLDCRTFRGWPVGDASSDPKQVFGAHVEIRTRDLFLTKEVLCRLSYVGPSADPPGSGPSRNGILPFRLPGARLDQRGPPPWRRRRAASSLADSASSSVGSASASFFDGGEAALGVTGRS